MEPNQTKHSTKLPDHFDYKDVKLLSRYVNQFGQIESRRRSGLSNKQQHELAVAIKRARHMALLPFVVR